MQRPRADKADLRTRLPLAQLSVAALLSIGLTSGVLLGNAGAPAADPAAPDPLRQQAQLFLKQHCVTCHGTKTQEGDLRLDNLAPEFTKSDSQQKWAEILKRIEADEMPPQKSPRPNQLQAQAVTRWIAAQLKQAASEHQRTEGRTVYRRLNRIEYENTLHELLGIDAPLADLLPDDDQMHGFDNVAEALGFSPVLMEKYLEAARAAIEAAIADAPRPKTTMQRFDYGSAYRKGREVPKYFQLTDDALVFLNVKPNLGWLYQFRAAAPGRYRFALSVYAYQSEAPLPFSFYTGKEGNWRLAGYYDAPPGQADKPERIEIEATLDKDDSLTFNPYVIGGARHHIRNGMSYDFKPDVGIAVQWIDVEGPLADRFPPASRAKLFGSIDPATGTIADARTILQKLVPRAFRRPVADAEIQPFLDLVHARLEQGYRFDQALHVGLTAVFCSSDFLFRKETPGTLDDYALASRLSYLLWSSTPDEILTALAGQGQLRDAKVLREQVERMLADAKARNFTRNFVGQWLNLRQIAETTPDAQLYPEFDELLRVSMVQETERFFEELLQHDLSVLNIIDSDFAMLNERLAIHYGIPNVKGLEVHKVTLPAGSQRGGVLTQGSVLKVTANGATTSPVVRGVWVLERILGQQVPPPPKDVPAIVPDTRGAVTIRQQLEKHRADALCATCHAKIDPPGFALENFDVTGAYRETYRVPGNRGYSYVKGPPVEAGDEYAGERFQNVVEFKRLLLSDKDGIARGVTEKLLTYATGTPVRPPERDAVEQIVQRARKNDYGFRSLIHEVVQSPLFRSK